MRIAHFILVIFLLPNFLFSQQEGFVYVNPPVTIVILGSSTAAGAGPSNIEDAWVNRYRRYVQGFNPNNQVINLAKGGYNSYHLLPSDAAKVPNRVVPDTVRNFTKASTFHPNGIIVNLPSNDISNGHSIKEQYANFKTYAEYAKSNDIELWATTTQPRSFPKKRDRELQVVMRDSLLEFFGDQCIDFWSGFSDDDLNVAKEYDSGDGCHLNAEGHRILNDRVIASQAFYKLLVNSSIQRDTTKPKVELPPHLLQIGFEGTLIPDSSESNEMRFVKIVQRDRTLNATNVIDDQYKIETIIDLSNLVHVRYEAPNSLTKIVVFDLSNIEKEEGEEEFVYYPVESMDIQEIDLSKLNYHFPKNELPVAEFMYDADNYGVRLNSEFSKFQKTRIEDAMIFPPQKGRKLMTYWEDGTKKSVHRFKKGQLHCKSTWYTENGEKKRVVYFKNGAYNGKYITFDAEGEKESLRKFKNDEQIGETEEFSEN